MLVASFGVSDGDSDYVKSAEKSPMRSANTPNLEGHISKLETMHEVSEGEIYAIVRPMDGADVSGTPYQLESQLGN